MPLSNLIAAISPLADLRPVSRLRFAPQLVFAALLLCAPLCMARDPNPPQRLPLTPFGFQTVSERYLLQGATMLTVDFVDNTHLLVTFGISRLMQRLPECPADDEDRTVKVVLLEVPSGRELASTEWRFHDLGQYLWNLGDGHFLLRNRDSLTLISPLQNLAAKPFAQESFLHFSRRIEAILVSADHDLLAIETVKPKAHAPLDPMLQVSTQPSSTAAPDPSAAPSVPPTRSTGLLRRDPNALAPNLPPVEISFIHLLHSDPAHIVAQLAARIHTEKVSSIPLTTEGFLETRAESKDGVLFHFITYTGKDLDLGDFATSCHPRPTFISHSEFVTYGCRGADESLDLAGFNLRGDLIWQINFTDTQAYPSFASAPAAGRFAFSRTITTSNVFGSETPSASQLTAQEIRVVQMYNGKQLLRAVANPIQRAGQNYALSPDGLTLAVIHDVPAPPEFKGEKPLHDPAVELFKLPAFTAKDLAEMKTEAAMAPPPSAAPMRFSLREIKDALNPKPLAPGSTDADSKIVGDTIHSTPESPDQTTAGRIVGDPLTSPSAKPSSITAAPPVEGAASSSATILTSDVAPACANLTAKSVAACPVNSATKPATTQPVKSNDDTSPEPEKRRKPPTLYEPLPAQTSPAQPQ
ncbi:hypothetical protein HDF16_000864 [Granulicella aggregans]|uniref:Uncharacterized protein n=1 Tax=Granulicella aggregans TaxID=474949 RepID=A0A7W8E3J2_9BACT|nr:hypothetical protein [Granulicella aggregans]MBB5056195.1 hypothetical protein [Granulicella aggregans]